MVDGPAKTPRQCSTMKCALSRSIDNSASGVNCFEKQITLTRLILYRQEFDDAKQGMIAAYGTCDYTLQAIADTFKVHYRR